MQLTYRGAKYTVQTQSIEIVETAQSTSFLGARCRIRAAKLGVPQRSGQTLSYRLNKYSV
ncbi:MAG: DUF4278 domain-containing protein [Cyanobacteria bacterium J06634_6]